MCEHWWGWLGDDHVCLRCGAHEPLTPEDEKWMSTPIDPERVAEADQAYVARDPKRLKDVGATTMSEPLTFQTPCEIGWVQLVDDTIRDGDLPEGASGFYTRVFISCDDPNSSFTLTIRGTEQLDALKQAFVEKKPVLVNVVIG